VLNPERFDVIVASNLFGDILSDLGAGDRTGTSRIAASEHQSRAHRAFISSRCMASAPTSPARKIGQSIATIWSGALMLEHLGHPQAGRIVRAIERVIPRRPRLARQ